MFEQVFECWLLFAEICLFFLKDRQLTLKVRDPLFVGRDNARICRLDNPVEEAFDLRLDFLYVHLEGLASLSEMSLPRIPQVLQHRARGDHDVCTRFEPAKVFFELELELFPRDGLSMAFTAFLVALVVRILNRPGFAGGSNS